VATAQKIEKGDGPVTLELFLRSTSKKCSDGLAGWRGNSREGDKGLGADRQPTHTSASADCLRIDQVERARHEAGTEDPRQE
jgi:hypothetical protein